MRNGRKLLALLLALCLLLTLLPFSALATETETETQLPDAEVIEPATEHQNTEAEAGEENIDLYAPMSAELPVKLNPLYEGIIDPAEIPQPKRPEISRDETYHTAATYISEEEAGTKVRSYLKSRTASFTVYVKSSNHDYNEIAENLLNIAFAHTGKPTEGDYLMWHWESYDGEVTRSYNNGYYEHTLTFYFTYYTTAAQEKEVDTAVSNLLRTLNVTYKSDYQKVCAVYDYICDNVTYDYEHLEDTSYTRMFTAYAALIDKTAVCQGYALLFYRLMLELGVDTRLIAGEGMGVAHAWNIVKLGNVYYNVDSTWDAGMDEYSFFLRNTLNFPGHARYLDYMTYEFHTEYPMSETDYVDGVAGVPEKIYVYGICGDNAYWALDREGTLTILGEGKIYDFSSSTILETCAPWKFWSGAIKHLVIEEGITYVGKYNFSAMHNITSLAMPSTLSEIADYAFSGCIGLTSIKLNEGLTTIGYRVFEKCSGLTSVTLPSSIISMDGYVFQECEALHDVTLSPGIEEIGTYAFYNCTALTKINIPESVTEMGTYIFSGCTALSEVGWPSTLTRIPEGTFFGCTAMRNIVIPEGVEIIGQYAFSNINPVSIALSKSLKVIENDAFRLCENVTSLTLPDGLKQIGKGAFSGCSITTLTVPSSVDYLSGFANCENLETVIFNNSGVIGERAFESCSKLKNIVFNGEITAIENFAFLDCDSLVDVDLPDTLITLSGFTSCDGITEIILPDSVEALSGFAYCSSLEYIDLNQVKYIGQEALSYCGKLTSIEIPDTVISIDHAAFTHCESLREVTIPKNVTYVSSCAFNFCTALEKVTWDAGCTIMIYAFEECTSLKEVVISGDVTDIDGWAFYGCTELEEIVIPATVKRLSGMCFGACKSLNTITFLGDAPEIYYNSFDDVTATAYYPAGNATWTEDVLQNYGGNITWVPVGPEVEFVGASLSLKGDIGLNFYAKISERILADTGAYMKFTGSGAARYLAMADGVLDESDGSYRYSVALNAKNMGDDVTAQVYNATGAVGDSKTLSIKYYADYVINNSSKESFVNLMKAMLNYGAAAQENFGYDTDNLVNADMEEADRLLPEELGLCGYAHTWSGEEPGIEVTSASLLLQSETKIRIYFKLAEGKTLEDFTFTIDGVEVIPVQSGEEYYIEKPNVAAKDLDNMYTFRLGDRQLEYCGLSYVNQVLSYSSDEKLLNLAKALYAYNQAANAYFQLEEAPAHGHNYESVVTEPTCTEDGYTTHTCTFCGDSYTDTEVSAVGHDYESVVTAPTCTEDGCTTHICSVCGDSYTDTETAALGHDWGEWTVTQEPTADAEGEETRTCQREGCDETETRAIEKLPAETEPEEPDTDCTEHTWGNWISDASGSYGSCTTCGESIIVDGSDSSFSDEAAELINDYRESKGLTRLTIIYSDIALIRAHELQFSLADNRLDGKHSFMYYDDWYSECVAGGSDPKTVVDGWINSADHELSLLSTKWSIICVACNNGRWVVIFG